jgi:hypothetical protein
MHDPSKPVRLSTVAIAIALAFSAALPAQSPQTTAAVAGAEQRPSRSVTEVDRARIENAAKRIDQTLEKALAQLGHAPTPLASDAEFLRRSYLTITGRIPSVAEAEAFAADPSNDKRARLVDTLLDSPGYTSHAANFWFDLLRVKSRLRQLSGEPFAHWIREAVRTSMPYDEFVTAMVTATGAAHAEGNGATGYLLRDMNMPHDAMANTLRIFTGTRLECAQCHNHPTESWKQREFFAMAAFYGGLQYRVELPADTQRALREIAQGADDRQKAATRRAIQSASIGLRGAGTGVERLPQDYAYEDLAPRSPIPAASIFGPKAKVDQPKTQASTPRRPIRRADATQRPQDVDSRRVFAEWLTSKDNERFTRTISNRMWQRVFGRALTEPLDDLKDDSKSVLPEVERVLQRLLVEFDFDLRQLQRVLLSTRLFARESIATDSDAPFLFQGPFQQRLSAEQLWDSLLTLQDERIDERLPPTGARARGSYARQEGLYSGDAEKIADALQRRPDIEAQAQLRQQMIARRREQDAERQERVRELTQQLLQARRSGDKAQVAALMKQRQEIALPSPEEAAAALRDGGYARASDLEQPASSGHLLRQFGQSDRETMDGASRAASVPQALSLLNGPLGNSAGSLARRIAAAPDTASRIRIAYLGVLTRSPNADEVELWSREFEQRGKDAAADLLWVLINSHEFRFCP